MRGYLWKQPADRLHARLHDRVLQVGDEQVELAHREVERLQGLGVGAPGEDVAAQRVEPVLGEADLARKVEHLVEAGGIHADRVVALALALAAADRRAGAGNVAGTAAEGGSDHRIRDCRDGRRGYGDGYGSDDGRGRNQSRQGRRLR